MYDLNKPVEYEREVVPSGKYECCITNAEIKSSKNTSKQYISLTFTIRKDVKQECQNKNVFASIFKTNVYRRNGKIIRKATYEALSPADKSQVIVTEEYQDNKIRALLLAQDADEGNRKTTFNSIEEIVMFLNGMNCLVTIDAKEPDDYHETEWNDVDFRNISRTEHSTQLNASNPQVFSADIDDSDLPF